MARHLRTLWVAGAAVLAIAVAGAALAEKSGATLKMLSPDSPASMSDPRGGDRVFAPADDGHVQQSGDLRLGGQIEQSGFDPSRSRDRLVVE